MNLVVFTDDARISDLHVAKRFGELPGVAVEVRAAA
jgi:Holliday junction resolvase RusA-like endonuclease